MSSEAINSIMVPWRMKKSLALWLLLFSPFMYFEWKVGKSSTIALLCLVILPATVAWLAAMYRTPSHTEVNFADGVVRRHYRRLFGKPRHKTYRLDEFTLVRSFLTGGRFPSNVVDMVSIAAGGALRIAEYRPLSIVQSLRGMKPGEAPDAKALRELLAARCGCEDHGFLGWRSPGVSVR